MEGFARAIEGMSSLAVFWIGVGVAVVVGLIVFFIVKMIGDAIRRTGAHYPQKGEAKNSQQIYTELVEVRALTSADRAMVLRFHNGMEFLPSNPVWKLTCTHEFAKQGVEYRAGDYQAVLASRMIKMVGTILTGESDDAGVRVALECGSCSETNVCEAGNRRMVVIQLDEMEQGFEHFTFQDQNVKTVLACGMTFNGQVVGFVMLHFCDAKLETEQGLGSAIKTLCESTQRIQFLIGNKTL